MKVISLKNNSSNEHYYPIDLIDSSLFYLSKTTTVFPVADFTIYEKKGQRTKAIHSVRDAIEFPYEFPFLSYAVRIVSTNQVFYTFYRFNLLSKEISEIGSVHFPFDAELEGVFMTQSEVMFIIRKMDPNSYDDEVTYYLFDGKKDKQYVINDTTFHESISTPTIFAHKGEPYLLLNPFYSETWEKEDLARNQDSLKVKEYIGVISLKQYIKDVKAEFPIHPYILDEMGGNGFIRVIAENADYIYYIRKEFHQSKEELIELNKDTFQKNSYPLPKGFSYHSIRIFNDTVYFVSTEEDYFYSPMKKEIFRLEHTYFQHLPGVMNVYVHYMDERYIVADCWTRNHGEDLFYVAIIDKKARDIQYFEDKSLGCEVIDQTVVIY
ncbi:hypothetical protein JOC85_000553 [Bacillus mesophilus]|uniref:Uncharacterized protein n=1 Tax=Bacillus mesophilus TaxID=1808955 RepID=A0A6M0Q2N0_9BACI|nr:hypothetical protein [Bacillus mesophilus]MBM7659786.1 hypothetical protein [Bacillus mesophilus]NEY70645.1 hypothetical protein [Bacillus mesophilus]